MSEGQLTSTFFHIVREDADGVKNLEWQFKDRSSEQKTNDVGTTTRV